MHELIPFLAEAARLVEAELDRLIPSDTVEPTRLHEAIRWSVFAGGKRFRPALLLAVGRTFGAPDEKLISTAAAIEMIHTYSLIHDDLPSMDDDDLRRGRETCHKKFGEATAILAGDALQTLAFKTIADDESLTYEMRIQLISEIAGASGTPVGMVAGQQLDLDAEGRLPELSEIETIHIRKTGALISAAAKAGAIIGEANSAEYEAIAAYASKLGLLFQITDDILDETENSETLGKTAGKDARSRKATYPAYHGLARSRELASELYRSLLSDPEAIERPTDLLIGIADRIANRQA